MGSKKAIIIIPTYNERENISKLIPVLLHIAQQIADWNVGVLVVDDNSPDNTKEVVSDFSKKQTNVHLFSNEKKQGLGHAYVVGMRHAFSELGADVVFEMDADFSHDPTRIPAFLDAIDSGADMVLGSRYIQGGSIPADWGFERKFLSVVGNMVNMVVLTDFRIRDWTTGYRAIRKKVFEAVGPEMDVKQFTGYTFQIGFLHKALRKRFVIKEIPIQFQDRKIGKSKLGPDYIKNALSYILKARYQEIVESRLFKFAVVGGIGFFINTVLLFAFSKIAAIHALAEGIATIPGLSFVNGSGLSSALGAECAIVSNFILNNFWTFSDRKSLTLLSTLGKFLQFNLSSFGAVAVQFVVVSFGTGLTGQETPSKMFWLVVATAIGMVINFTIYSQVIWKTKRA